MESRDLGYLTTIVRTILLTSHNLLVKLLEREADKQSFDWETVEYLLISLLEINHMMADDRLELSDLPEIGILFETSHLFLKQDWERKIRKWSDHDKNPDYRWLINTIHKLSTETSDAYIGTIVSYFNSQPFKNH